MNTLCPNCKKNPNGARYLHKGKWLCESCAVNKGVV